MKQVILLSVVLLTSFFIVGCPPINPSMYCEPMYDTGRCIDGSWPEVCINYSGTQCAYKVMGDYYYCDGCYDCDYAAMAGISACYGYYFSTEDMRTTDQDREEVDESIIEMKVEAFKNALELLKKTNE